MGERVTDKTALSWWFPKIEAAGLPVPKTIIVDMPETAQKWLWSRFDNPNEAEHDGDIEPFLKELQEASYSIGRPFFLRTDHTSGKHEWNTTCFVTHYPDIKEHVAAIAYFSECAGIIGLSWAKWAVREFLPVISLGWCPQYGGMPVNREFRFFVEEGAVRCWHPYWPEDSLRKGGIGEQGIVRLRGPLYTISQHTEKELHALAAAAGKAVGGAWSVDILETENGWYVTDMAEADKSFHWPDCPSLTDSGKTAGKE